METSVRESVVTSLMLSIFHLEQDQNIYNNLCTQRILRSVFASCSCEQIWLQIKGLLVRTLIRPHTFMGIYHNFYGHSPPSADSRRADVSFWQKYVHQVLVNRLERLSQPRNSVVRITDRRYMTEIIRRKTPTQTKSLHLLSLIGDFGLPVHEKLPLEYQVPWLIGHR